MSIETAYRKILIDVSPVQQRAGDRVYLGRAPQNERRDRVVLTLISNVTPKVFDGSAGWAYGTMQVDCFASSYEKAKELADVVAGALDGYEGIVLGTRVDRVDVEDRRDIPSVPLEGNALPTFGVSLDTSWQVSTDE